MKKKVTQIPATKTKYSSKSTVQVTKRRVAGYARVSTDSDEQFTSYEAQVDYYTNYIKQRADWEFVSIYTDEGISGTNTKYREGFNHMVEDALNKKIDLIITKSVSRFARNTVDSLTTVRNLKDAGVEVYFEKENIWTFDSKGELLITIMSSLAQEESRSISENVTWGQRKRFADGKVTVPFANFLGYDKGPDGNLVVNKEEAKLVKRIYHLFIEGYSPYRIAKILTEEGIPTIQGKKKWSTSSIRSILTNEKYKGDALLQKSFTVNFLTKEKKINEGEIPQYYVEKNHEAIIKPKIWDFVQDMLENRPKYNHHIFSSKILCGSCGTYYGPKTWHSNTKYRRTIWRCNKKYTKKEEPCKTPHLYEENIKKAFIDSVNELIANKEHILEDLKMVEDIFDTSQLQVSLELSIDKMNACKAKIEKLIEDNSKTSQDQIEYAKKYEKLVNAFNDEKENYERLAKEISEKESRKLKYDFFIEKLNLLEPLEEFDPLLWNLMLEKMVVHEDGSFEFKYANGI
ncbi:recombinase family protein [Anaerococcus sp. AGMB00486]|uniref:Recombinase family protein n=1 Tax=Anaerococcus faecalis TaxID=2742993 RepID=A0ABX2NAD6_9FIRM|nr:MULTISPECIES: recombinase family protein [Anaerococcus]MDY3007234.1 recombinase family protein [Anaerococcus porci]NVF11660.1 recombinase family protein [Anaerococcus faecalis]